MRKIMREKDRTEIKTRRDRLRQKEKETERESYSNHTRYTIKNYKKERKLKFFL